MKERFLPFLEGLLIGLFLGAAWFIFTASEGVLFEDHPQAQTKVLQSTKPFSTKIDTFISQSESLEIKNEMSRLNTDLKKNFFKRVPDTGGYSSTPSFTKPSSGVNLGDIYSTTESHVPEDMDVEDQIEGALAREDLKYRLKQRREKAYVKAFIQRAREIGFDVKINKDLEIIDIRKKRKR